MSHLGATNRKLCTNEIEMTSVQSLRPEIKSPQLNMIPKIDNNVVDTSKNKQSTTVAHEFVPIMSTICYTEPMQFKNSFWPAGRSLIIFDWDDTCFACTEFAKRGIDHTCSEEVRQAAAHELQQLDYLVQQTFYRALEMARVIIVTNADEGWVEATAQRFLPGVARYFPFLTIISARALCMPFESNIYMWKRHAFDSCVQQFLQPCPVDGTHTCNIECRFARRQILSIGDSLLERDAVQCMAFNHPGLVAKSLKLIDQPSVAVLENQHKAMYTHLAQLFLAEREFDRQLLAKPANNNNNN